MNNKISIILSTYNEYHTVEKTISEIFLKLENVEIIVVDDNSNDGTLEKLNSIKNENLKVFSRNTRGLASAFLLGMINTAGNYIGWTDSNMPQKQLTFPGNWIAANGGVPPRIDSSRRF